MATLERAYEAFKPNAMFAAGALFGAGWWVWGDAVCVSAVQGEPFQPAYVAPGLVATLAILVMNCVPRSELSDNIYGDDAALCRSRICLFISYVFSVAGIAAAVGVLLHLKAQEQTDLWIGAAGIIQACLIVAGGLMSWWFREADDDGDFIY